MATARRRAGRAGRVTAVSDNWSCDFDKDCKDEKWIGAPDKEDDFDGGFGTSACEDGAPVTWAIIPSSGTSSSTWAFSATSSSTSTPSRSCGRGDGTMGARPAVATAVATATPAVAVATATPAVAAAYASPLPHPPRRQLNCSPRCAAFWTKIMNSSVKACCVARS